MNKLMLTLLFAFIGITSNSDDELEVIYANIFDESYKDSRFYVNYIEEYKDEDSVELWGAWSCSMGNYSSSSFLAPYGGNSYQIENVWDYDLNTAWIPSGNPFGIGEYIEVEFDYPENTSYASAYQFQGIGRIFNGYCKSLSLWNANSRVKKLKVYYNDVPVCLVELIDSWQIQEFDISKFFVDRRHKKHMDAKFEIKNGDKLRFEIVEVYKGDKYSDVAISEFLCEGGGN